MNFGYNPYAQTRPAYGAQPYQSPGYQAPPMGQPIAQPMQSNGIVWVQGEDAAKSYYVPAGCTAQLMDSESQTFYIKTVDPSGIPQPLRVFDYTERGAQAARAVQTPSVEYVTAEQYNALVARLEALERGANANGEQLIPTT